MPANHQRPRDGVELAFAWMEAFQTGDARAMDRLLTRPFTFRPAGRHSTMEPTGRRRFLELVPALHMAFPDWRFRRERIEEWEHTVYIDVGIEATHKGPLDLSFMGIPACPPTGERLRLPAQRLEWDVIHGQVHGVRVCTGPGLGVDLILETLGLDPFTPEPEGPGAVEADPPSPLLHGPARARLPRQPEVQPAETEPHQPASRAASQLSELRARVDRAISRSERSG